MSRPEQDYLLPPSPDHLMTSSHQPDSNQPITELYASHVTQSGQSASSNLGDSYNTSAFQMDSIQKLASHNFNGAHYYHSDTTGIWWIVLDHVVRVAKWNISNSPNSMTDYQCSDRWHAGFPISVKVGNCAMTNLCCYNCWLGILSVEQLLQPWFLKKSCSFCVLKIFVVLLNNAYSIDSVLIGYWG